ncbi:MAG TPA: cytochrome c biogenesis protein CcsA [Acidimicrobiia bacterium]
MKTRVWLDLAAAGAVAVAFGFAVAAPPEEVQGDFVTIMYVHVPSAWLAYLAFAVTLIGGIVWLLTRSRRWDRLAASSAELGVFFTGLALVTGMIWGRPTWGTWWEWGDARMTTTALMFLVYLGYLGLRRAEPDPETRARRSAIMGIVAFAVVPIVHFSVLWWRTLHQPPTILTPDPAPIDSEFLTPLFVALFAFTLVYASFTARRTELARLEDRLEEIEEPLAETTVEPPSLSAVEDV